MNFSSRQHAGQLLSQRLTQYAGADSLVLGLARGGMVLASVVAQTLHASLDVLIVKKVTSTTDPELAIGALAPEGVSSIDWKFAQRFGIDEDIINKNLLPSLREYIQEKTRLYRHRKKPIDAAGKTFILVDDGIATGATMRAAVAWARKKHPQRIVVAAPLAPPEFIPSLKPNVDDVVILETPHDFRAVGQFYDDFPQVTDEEVVELLKRR